MQQLREAVGLESQYEYLLHDRDSIFAEHLDESIVRLGIGVLKSPPRCPMANAICERVIGTIRRECLDWLVPLSESHLRSILSSWIPHYNTGRPHMGLGPGVPDPLPATLARLQPLSRHRRGESYAVDAHPILGGLHHPILGGLHHEYFLAPAAALLNICGLQPRSRRRQSECASTAPRELSPRPVGPMIRTLLSDPAEIRDLRGLRGINGGSPVLRRRVLSLALGQCYFAGGKSRRP
jgi:hypothetical protein